MWHPKMCQTLSRQGCSESLILVCGGQSGVDRAVLDVGLELGVALAGWCPAGRWAEDGPISLRYPLRTTPSRDTAQRTVWNVHLGEALLVLNDGHASQGTALAVRAAEWLKRPVLMQNTAHPPNNAANWLRAGRIQVVNVAGPRHSEAQGIYAAAFVWLKKFVGCYGAAVASMSQNRSTSAGVL